MCRLDSAWRVKDLGAMTQVDLEDYIARRAALAVGRLESGVIVRQCTTCGRPPRLSLSRCECGGVLHAVRACAVCGEPCFGHAHHACVAGLVRR